MGAELGQELESARHEPLPKLWVTVDPGNHIRAVGPHSMSPARPMLCISKAISDPLYID